MSNAEAMRAALELIEKDIEERPIAAVIYTAASVNHYGGVGALLEDAAAAIPIIAPRGFLDAAGTENLFTENSFPQAVGVFIWQPASGQRSGQPVHRQR